MLKFISSSKYSKVMHRTPNSKLASDSYHRQNDIKVLRNWKSCGLQFSNTVDSIQQCETSFERNKKGPSQLKEIGLYIALLPPSRKSKLLGV